MAQGAQVLPVKWDTGKQRFFVADDDRANVVAFAEDENTGKVSFPGLGRDINLLDFSPIADGVTDTKEQIKKALLAASGSKLVIPSGNYFCDIRSDNDTILIPANTEVLCEPGCNFIYSGWGSPLFGIVESDNVRFKGYTITYSGTFGTTSGSRTFKTWAYSVPAYRFCADIVLLGSNQCVIKGTHASVSTSNVQNIGILVEGVDDGTTNTYSNTLNIIASGRCNSVMTSAQTGFDFTVRQGYLPQNSTALYGPGHAVYDVVERASVSGVYHINDTGEYVDSLDMTGSHSISLKNAKSVTCNITSKRTAGALNFAQCLYCTFNINYESSSTVDTSNNGAIFYTGQGGVSDGNKFDINCNLLGAAHPSRVFATSAASVNAISNTSANISFFRNVSGTEIPAILLGDTGGSFIVNARQVGNNTRPIVDFGIATNTVVDAHISSGGSRCVFGTGTGNIFKTSGKFATQDYNTSVGTSGNTISQSLAKVKNSVTVSGADPTSTIQLPSGGGCFLVWLNLTSSDYNHARGGLYMVMYDDASVNDFTICQLIGSQITKGANAPTVLNMSVSNSGLLTMTSTAVSTTYYMEFGYSEMNKR